MKLTIILLFFCLIFFLCFTEVLSAQENLSAVDRLIASTFKTLAKVYLTTVNFDKLKNEQIGLLEKMDEAKFQKRFRKVSLGLNTLPSEFKQKYGFKDQMTKAEVIQEIRQLDIKTVGQMIEKIPNEFIASQFKQYLSSINEDVRESQMLKKIQEFWSNITPR